MKITLLCGFYQYCHPPRPRVHLTNLSSSLSSLKYFSSIGSWISNNSVIQIDLQQRDPTIIIFIKTSIIRIALKRYSERWKVVVKGCCSVKFALLTLTCSAHIHTCSIQSHFLFRVFTIFIKYFKSLLFEKILFVIFSVFMFVYKVI